MKTILLSALAGMLATLVVGVVVLLAVRPLEAPPAAAAPVAEETRVEAFSADPSEEYFRLHHAPTPPAQLERLILPWEPQAGVVVALPFADFRSNPALLATILEFLAVSLEYVDVYALFPRTERAGFAEFLSLLDEDPRFGGEKRRRIHFVQAEVASVWVRDYGPVFGANRRGELVVLDAIFGDAGLQMQQSLLLEGGGGRWGQAEDAAATLQRLRGDDLAPAALASYLHIRAGRPTVLVRPNLFLSGGDFMPVRAGTALLSQTTLAANGGLRENVDGILRRYYGVEKTLYLSSLPGDGIDHLDFVVQAFGEDRLLIAGSILPSASPRPWIRNLEAEIDETLRINRERLRAAFPEAQIHEIPLPPVLVTPRAEVARTIAARVRRQLAGRLGVEAGTPAEREAAVDAFLRERFEASDLAGSEELLDRVLLQLFGRPFADLERAYAETSTQHRSHVNSLLLHAPDGRRAVILPRFRPTQAAEAAALAQVEERVEAVYRQMLPDAALHWVDCSALVGDAGAVHCFALPLPLRP